MTMQNKITNEVRARIVLMYPEAMLNHKDGHIKYEAKNVVCWHIAEDFNNIQDYSLLLTPLKMISDEAAINIAKILDVPLIHPGSKTPASDQFLMGKGVEFLLNNYANESYKNLNILSAYDYLRQLGYALPVTVVIDGKPVTYSVDQLVEEGIFKLKTE